MKQSFTVQLHDSSNPIHDDFEMFCCENSRLLQGDKITHLNLRIRSHAPCKCTIHQMLIRFGWTFCLDLFGCYHVLIRSPQLRDLSLLCHPTLSCPLRRPATHGQLSAPHCGTVSTRIACAMRTGKPGSWHWS